jgi:hypothetical protein
MLSEINEANGQVVDSYVSAVGVAGTGVNNALPSEVAMCVSIRETNGVVRGRFYLPPPTVNQITATGLFNSTFVSDQANRVQDLFQTLGGLTAPARLGIYSRKLHQFRGSTQISIGNVPDAQRRRRNKLIEARQSRTIA